MNNKFKWEDDLLGVVTIVGHSLNIVTELPLHLFRMEKQNVAQEEWIFVNAYTESALVHTRLLICFLLAQGKKDLRVNHYSSWRVDKDSKIKMNSIVETISSWLLHYGERRGKDERYPGFLPDHLFSNAEYIIQQFEEFVLSSDLMCPDRWNEVIKETRQRLENVREEVYKVFNIKIVSETT